jgi:hypothetical protein
VLPFLDVILSALTDTLTVLTRFSAPRFFATL